MKKYKLSNFGNNAQGVMITGDPTNQEPEHFIVKLPFGEVEITRTTDNNYWVHVAKRKDDITGEHSGSLSKFRLDSIESEGVYMQDVKGEHLAVLLSE